MTLESWLESRAGLAGKKLQAAVRQCEENFVESVSDLRQLAEDQEQFEKVIPQGMIRSVILKALKTSEDDDTGSEETEDLKTSAGNKIDPRTQKPAAGSSDELTLPSGFRFHYFVSHRKNHSTMNNVTEIQVLLPLCCFCGHVISHQKAIMTKDFLTGQGLLGFFDVRSYILLPWSISHDVTDHQVDNLTSVDMSTLTKSVQDSCCLVLFLVRNTTQIQPMNSYML